MWAQPSDARDVLADADPVAAVLAAHRAGEPIALRTSGTSGPPRCVVRTVDSWVASFPAFGELFGVSGGSRVWVPGPLTSTMNLFAAVHATWLGAELTSGLAEATHAQLTPTALARMVADGVDIRGRHLLVAGDRLAQPLHDRAVAAGATVGHYYGAAELSFVAWGSHEANLQPFPEVEISVRAGLLWVRSPFLSQGYVGPAGPFRVTPDGWATVGDRGDLVDGLVRLRGRDRDGVTTAGATVPVVDVEDGLRPVLRGEVAVVGVPHADLGQVLVAVLTDPEDLEPARMAARATFAPSHRPRRWCCLGRLPQTPAGKLDRDEVARLVSTGDAAPLL